MQVPLLKPPIIALISVLERFQPFKYSYKCILFLSTPSQFLKILLIQNHLIRQILLDISDRIFPVLTHPMPKFFDQSVANILRCTHQTAEIILSSAESAIVLKPSMISFKPWKRSKNHL